MQTGARFSTRGRPARYASYLLRLWREGGAPERWRASLHDPHTGERFGFAGLDEVFSYLHEQTDAAPCTNRAEKTRERR